MTLLAYKKKRTFSKTPEPRGGKAVSGSLRFVVQKHDASHLHYDFRLEIGGVLKSWAVPKGPSTDPSVKRLAMMVEDHPYNYKDFEGLIPKGQYGGGTVIIWDEGNYEAVGGDFEDSKSMEKCFLQQLRKGKIHFILHGRKLHGEFALVKSSRMGQNAWLLMKVKDKFANKSDITKKEKSVVSGKSLKQIEKTSTNIFEGHEAKSTDKVSNITFKTKDRFPTLLSPMLATLVEEPFDRRGWSYEIKWDGYRCMAFLNKQKVALRSRNNKSFNEKFYPLYDALKELSLNAIIDGEVVVIDEKGKSNFGNLQNWRSEADGELRFYVFDLVWCDGQSMLKLPWVERRQKLEDWLPVHPLIQISKSFMTSGVTFFKEAKKMGLEGIMAKKMDSLYVPGARSREWLKIKIAKRNEVVIGGYTTNAGTNKVFSSLLVGVYNKGHLTYTGKIGTGFTEQEQKLLLKQFQPFKVKKSPFAQEPDINNPSRFRPNPPIARAAWLKPVLVCEVAYTEITADGLMRHPAFQGMRIDKKAKDVRAEIAKNVRHIGNAENSLGKKKYMRKSSGNSRKTLLNPVDETQERSIEKHTLKFSHLSKIYWPVEKILKRDLLNYYYQVAPIILPYLKDRPQSLNRHPNGIKGKAFYQKDVSGKVPDWIETFPYHSVGDNRDKKFMVCTNEASLLYMVSLGCIEINPWSSRIQSPNNPDWCVIDLDPDNNRFDQVIETARVTHQILEDCGVSSCCKTSGSTGLHIYIPLGAKYTYDQSKEFARLIVTLVNQKLPKITSIERATKNREGKIYLDFLQNRPQATLAAPYSVRPKPGATVSMPLHWEEVKKGLSMKDFTIKNAMERINEQGDIFKRVLGKGIPMQKVLKVIAQQIS